MSKSSYECLNKIGKNSSFGIQTSWRMNRNIKLLTWFNFFTDFKLYAPIAILYFAQVTGSFALGMSIFSIAYVSAALFEIPTGIYSDFIGRRKTVILGAVSTILFSIFYAIGQSFWFLV